MSAASVGLRRVGSITVADLAAICALRGLEQLPYPFFTRTWGIARQSEAVQERLADGDLHVFQGWIKS